MGPLAMGGSLWRQKGLWEWDLWEWGVSGNGVSGNGVSGNGVFLGMGSPRISPAMALMDPPHLACQIPFPVPPAPGPAPTPLPAPLTLPEAGVDGVGGLGPAGGGPAAQLDQLVQPQLAAVNGGGLGLQRDQQLLRRLRGHQPGLRGHTVTRRGGDGGSQLPWVLTRVWSCGMREDPTLAERLDIHPKTQPANRAPKS